jgi:hypothetical protein
MRYPRRLSLLFFIGVLAAGSTALGVYYYFVYEPPLAAAEAFMQAMAGRDEAALRELVLVTPDRDSTSVRAPKPEEVTKLLKEPFRKGRVWDQKRLEGASRNYHYLAYREPDGSVYALLVTQVDRKFKVVIPETPKNPEAPYLWDYDWTN